MLLDFLWHARGEVPLASSASSAVAMEHVADLFHELRKSVRYERENYATFEGYPFGLIYMRWWQRGLAKYDRGRFGIAETPDGRVLRYEFRSLSSVLILVAVAGVALIHGAANGGIAAGVRLAGIFLIVGLAFQKLNEATLVRHAIRRVVERA